MRKLADICRMSQPSFRYMHLQSVGSTLMNIFRLNEKRTLGQKENDKQEHLLSDGSATHTQFVMFTVCTTGSANPAPVLRRMLLFRRDTYVIGTVA
jgi:hypothetical protein